LSPGLRFSEIKLTIHGTLIKKKLLNKPKKWLNSKKNGLHRPKKLVKQKTIRVLLDTGSSGDLLFIKKGSQNYIPAMKRAIAQSWGTSNGTFQTKKVGVIDTELKHLCTT